MSSCPGHTLEEFLAWNYNVDLEDGDVNPSLSIAEALGNIPRRALFSAENMKLLCSVFEEHREQVESVLMDFDDDTQSWRDYAGSCFDFVGDKTYDKGGRIVKLLKALRTRS